MASFIDMEMTIGEHEAARIKPVHQPDVMRGDDDRRAQALQLEKQAHQPPCQRRIDIACRFIGEQELRPRDQRPRDGRTLLLSAREHGRQRMHALAEADPPQQLDDFATIAGLFLAGDTQGQRDILIDREMIEQAEILEDHAHATAQLGEAARPDTAYIPAEMVDHPARGLEREQDEAQQRCLSGTRWAGEILKGARRDLEREIMEHFRPHPVAQANILEADHAASPPGVVTTCDGAISLAAAPLYAALTMAPQQSRLAIHSGAAKFQHGHCRFAMLIVCPTCASEYDVDPAMLGADGRRVRCSGCGEHWFAAAPAPAGIDAAPAVAPGGDDLEAQWRAAALNDPDVQEALAQAGELGGEKTTGAMQDASGADDASPASPEAVPNGVSDTGAPEALEGENALGATGAGAPAARKTFEKTDRAKARKARLRRVADVGAPRRRSYAGLAAMLGLVFIGLTLWQRETLARHVPALAGPLAVIGLPVNIRGAAFENVAGELVSDPSGRFLIVQAQISNVTAREAQLAPVEIVVRDKQGKAIYTWAAEPQKLKLGPGEQIAFRTRLAQPPAESHDVQLRFQRASAQMAQTGK